METLSKGLAMRLYAVKNPELQVIGEAPDGAQMELIEKV
jgi:hypothetical protein